MLRRGWWIRVVYGLCLLAATVNHVRALLTYGWSREGLPLGTSLYWTSLTIFDPLAALLLFRRPRAGIVFTVAIIVSDVAHNLWFNAAFPSGSSFVEDVASNFFVMSQIAFLLFVAATAPMAWRTSKDPATFR